MTNDGRVELECVGGPLDGEFRSPPPPLWECPLLIDARTGAEYELRWTATSSIWQWVGLRDTWPPFGSGMLGD